MAYMSQDRKKELTPGIKSVLKKHSMKGTISVDHHSTLCVTVREGVIDFGEQRGVNPYYIDRDYAANPPARDFLMELKNAMDVGNYDNSDPMSDYFDVGWYVEINIGGYEKPYVCTKAGV